MSAIDWIRARAEIKHVDVWRIEPAEAESADCMPGLWRATRWIFRGRVPARMRPQIQREYGRLVRTESAYESLTLDRHLNCEFIRSEYERIAP